MANQQQPPVSNVLLALIILVLCAIAGGSWMLAMRAQNDVDKLTEQKNQEKSWAINSDARASNAERLAAEATEAQKKAKELQREAELARDRALEALAKAEKKLAAKAPD